MTIEFFIPGNPQSLKRHRTTKTGHTYDPSAGDKADFLAMAMAHKPAKPLEEPLAVGVTAYFGRPQSSRKHYSFRKGKKTLRPDAPYHCVGKSDTDNLLKFVLDALNGKFWKDDRYVVRASVVKLYEHECHPPGMAVIIRDVAEGA